MQTAHYGTLVIRPHSMQFAIDELPLLLLCLAGYGCAWIENLAGSGILSGASVLCSLYLLYRFIYLRRTEYLISSEQIIYRHGVFSRSCDYMELYRVVDFREHRSFLQQLTGLKTVSVYSGDRMTPKLDIRGVEYRTNLVDHIRERVETNKQRRVFMRLQTVSLLLLMSILWVQRAVAQYVQTNPLEWMALAEGNEAINGEIESQTDGQLRTAALQNTIAAEFNKIHEWERKYSSYLQTASGYASSLKAATTLYEDGVRIFISLGRLRKAVSNNPLGVIATLSMNNLYIETATELVTVYTLLRNAVATGGPQNMLTGAERSETMWALADKLGAFNKKLNKLCLSIRYYTMMDVWNNITSGMIDRDNSEIAHLALDRWKRAARAARY